MSGFEHEFEDISVCIDGKDFTADFTVYFTFTTEGRGRSLRPSEIDRPRQTVTLFLTDEDGESAGDREITFPPRDDVARQIDAEIWRREDDLFEDARAELESEYIDAMEMRREAEGY